VGGVRRDTDEAYAALEARVGRSGLDEKNGRG
jgi:hypothetical protein